MARITPIQFKNQARSLAHSLPSSVMDAIMLSALEAESHFDEGFDNEGFKDDRKVEKWKPNSKETIRRKGHNKVLTGKTKKLRRSQKRVLLNSQGRQGARITYGAKYAAWMNNGFVNSRGKTVPARKFIGGSSSLNRKISRIINGRVRQHFNTKYYIGK